MAPKAKAKAKAKAEPKAEPKAAVTGVKRKRIAAESTERADRLVKHILAGQSSEIAFEHLAMFTEEDAAARAVHAHGKWAEVWELICKAVLGNETPITTDATMEVDAPLRADAFQVVLNLMQLQNTRLQDQIWGFMKKVIEIVGSSFIMEHEEAQNLAHRVRVALPAGAMEFVAALVMKLPEDQKSAALDLFFPGDTLTECLSKLTPCSSVVLRFVCCLQFAPRSTWYEAKFGFNQAAVTAMLDFLAQHLLRQDLNNPGDVPAALGNLLNNAKVDVMTGSQIWDKLLSNAAVCLSCLEPGRFSNMLAWAIYKAFEKSDQQGQKHFASHANAKCVMSGMIKCASAAKQKDPEALALLSKWLKDESMTSRLLDGDCRVQLTRQIGVLLSAQPKERPTQQCLTLLLDLADAAGPSAILSEPDVASDLLRALGKIEHGLATKCLDCLIPALQWQPKLVRFIPLEYKRQWVSRQVRPTASPQADTTVDLVIHREKLLDGLCRRLDRPSADLRRGIAVRFGGDGENGTGDGHRREFFQLTAKELTDPDFGLFRSHDGSRSLHISSTAADAQPDHAAQFELCGKLIGLALLHKETLPSMRFTSALCKLLLHDGPLDLQDMATVDRELYEKKLQYLSESRYEKESPPLTIEDLALTFEDVPQADVFPDVRHELCPGGKQMDVTEKNKRFYLWLLCDHRLNRSVRPHVDALRKGFNEVVPPDVHARIARVVNAMELSLLLCGMENFDVSAWKAHTVYESIEAETKDLFWSVVQAMTQQERCALLDFVTGSPTLPVGGFQALSGYQGATAPFTVAQPPQRDGRPARLPTAATCFNKLYLPAYTTAAEMRGALLEAVANRRSGFNEGAVAH